MYSSYDSLIYFQRTRCPGYGRGLGHESDCPLLIRLVSSRRGDTLPAYLPAYPGRVGRSNPQRIVRTLGLFRDINHRNVSFAGSTRFADSSAVEAETGAGRHVHATSARLSDQGFLAASTTEVTTGFRRGHGVGWEKKKDKEELVFHHVCCGRKQLL